MSDIKRCSGHEWKWDRTLYVCTRCGAPGYVKGSGGRAVLTAYPPHAREEVLARHQKAQGQG